MDSNLEHLRGAHAWPTTSSTTPPGSGGPVMRPRVEIGAPISPRPTPPSSERPPAIERDVASTHRDADAKKPPSPHARRRTLATLVEAIAAVEEGGTLDRIAQREQAREARLRRAEANDPAEPSPWPCDDVDATPSVAPSSRSAASLRRRQVRHSPSDERISIEHTGEFDHPDRSHDLRHGPNAAVPVALRPRCDATEGGLVCGTAEGDDADKHRSAIAITIAIDDDCEGEHGLACEAPESRDDMPLLAAETGHEPIRGRVPRSISSHGVRLQTGWAAIDQALGGGLPLGGLHEWMVDPATCGLDGQRSDSSRTTSSPSASEMLDRKPLETRSGLDGRGSNRIEPIAETMPQRSASVARLRPRRSPIEPPLGAIIHLLWRLLDGRCDRRLERIASPRILWIGRRTFPHPRALLRGGPCPWHDREFAAACAGAATTAGAEATGAKSPSGREPWMDPWMDPWMGGSPRPRSGRVDPARFGDATWVLASSESRRERDFDRRLLEASWCLDPSGGEIEARAWAIEQAVRCRGVVAVVADGRGFRMPLTRRLHLAAKSAEANGEPTLLLLLREPNDANAISAASTRWRVSPRSHAASEDDTDFGWSVALIRRRGAFAAAFSESREGGPAPHRHAPMPFDPLPAGWTDAVSRDPPGHLDETAAASADSHRNGSEIAAVRSSPRGGSRDPDRSPRVEGNHVCRTPSASPARTRREGFAIEPVSGGDAAMVVDRPGKAALAACATAAECSAERDDRIHESGRGGDSLRRSGEPRRRSDPRLPHPHHADARPRHREVSGGGLGPLPQHDSLHPNAGDGADRSRRGAGSASHDPWRPHALAPFDRPVHAAGAARARSRRKTVDLPSLFDGLSTGNSAGT